MYSLIINIENIHVIMGCDTGFFACPMPPGICKEVAKKPFMARKQPKTERQRHNSAHAEKSDTCLSFP